jgi:dynein intermediate chain 1
LEEVNKTMLDSIPYVNVWVKQQASMGHLKDPYENDTDVVIHLTSKNPQRLMNVVRFSHCHGEYSEARLSEFMIDHLELESTTIHRYSDEGQAQLQKELMTQRANKTPAREKNTASRASNDVEEEGEKLEDDEQEKEKQKKKKDQKKKKGKKVAGKKGKKEEGVRKPGNRAESLMGDDEDELLEKPKTNQFLRVERATQTMNRATKSTQMQTSPAPRAVFNALVTQWVIYDRYILYEAAKEAAEERAERADQKVAKVARRRLTLPEEVCERTETNRKMIRCARILERIVNQNNFSDIALDFRFYEDQADDARETNEGTLLPLWKFVFEKAGQLEVTALCWTPAYNDLFAVAFGSYNLYRQSGPGVVALFSLKNPSFPEYQCWASCGIMCVDIHPQHPHMVVAGLYDGNVVVYNLQRNTSKPAYISNASNGKHGELVWQVRWAPDNDDGYLNFHSISGDGRVSNWTLVKAALWCTNKLELSFSRPLRNISEEFQTSILKDSGRAFAFKPDDPDLYLVGVV